MSELRHIESTWTQGEVDRINLAGGAVILIDREDDSGHLRVGVYAKGATLDLLAGRSVFVLINERGEIADVADEK